ncbi:MAG: glucoamylase family protein [Prolixibacteraceae bacterium]|jgi:hypothetical protein
MQKSKYAEKGHVLPVLKIRFQMVIRMTKILLLFLILVNCKSNDGSEPDPVEGAFYTSSLKVNGKFSGYEYKGINTTPEIKITFSVPFRQSSAAGSVVFENSSAAPVEVKLTYENGDSTLVIKPSVPLGYLAKYVLNVTSGLKSKSGVSLPTPVTVNFLTAIDSTNKYPVISDVELLTLVQKQTFNYFWNFGHSVSGLARERNTSGDIVTSGGSGFGIMAIPVAIERSFISRNEGLIRMQTIVGFLKNKAERFHGAYSHWLNGTSGIVVPFGEKDNGADIVETSYLMMGLLTVRQYFNTETPEETQLRADINEIWNGVEWDWFRKNNENVLYWNWSPDHGFAVNVPVVGWNECLITYVMAASSTTHSIPKIVYDNGFARNGAIKNGGMYYGINLPLGTAYGGPLFFEQYSFLGINPNGLSDTYADYKVQAINHSLINYEYCKANPGQNFGYSDQCWGLTASDIQNGYTASSPTNDVGVIAPTAAISSIPFTPENSLRAMKFFYYQLGDKIWGQYGFKDAFSLNNAWFADSYLAIDQGPQIGMIENYRTGLLWNLFMSCPEVQAGLTKLGFTYKLN